jgi:hypothetical protein
MRILAVPLPVLAAVVGLCASSDTPYPIFTPDNLAGSMKLVGRNFAAAKASLGGKDFEAAKAQLVHTRELLATTITFWRNRSRADAIRILRDTLTEMDDLDAVLSGDTVDAVRADAMATQISADCQACHTVYREQDPATKAYRLKSGSAQ